MADLTPSQLGLGALLIFLSLVVPILTLYLEPRSRIVRFLSPVVVAYVVGMLFGNQPWLDFSDVVALRTCDVTVALAIPLLLYSTNIIAWARLARSTVLSFFFCMISVMVVGALAHLALSRYLPESAHMAGMLAGVYTGGTPNMAAISTGLSAKPETFILLNAADMIASFVYLLFILTVARKLLGRWMPAFKSAAGEADEGGELDRRWPDLPSGAMAFGLTVLIVAAALGVSRLVPEGMRDAVAILILTSLAVAASLSARVRALRGTQNFGQFLLLVFCVAMGFTTDFSKLFDASPVFFLFVLLVLFGSVLLHFFLAWLARIDRDTVLITSTAAIFGPHMVGPVAVALKNKEILFSGLASGLVGYAVGNYLGLALAWMLS